MRAGRVAGSERAMTIDYFNERHPLHRVKVWAALRARRRMYARVLRLTRVGPEDRILDVGVTPDVSIPYNNFFERWYPYSDRITACSIEDCSDLERVFPGLMFRRVDAGPLPFADKSFDVSLSFAVLEHVGACDRQRSFLAECARVADTAVVYVPYRYFPVEMHTFTPFLHWLPRPWHRAVWRWTGKEFWAREENLNLPSLGEVRRLLPGGIASRVRLVWSLGWPSNIEIVMGRAAAAPLTS